MGKNLLFAPIFILAVLLYVPGCAHKSMAEELRQKVTIVLPNQIYGQVVWTMNLRERRSRGSECFYRFSESFNDTEGNEITSMNLGTTAGSLLVATDDQKCLLRKKPRLRLLSLNEREFEKISRELKSLLNDPALFPSATHDGLMLTLSREEKMYSLSGYYSGEFHRYTLDIGNTGIRVVQHESWQ